jgi:hypothetical protein
LEDNGSSVSLEEIIEHVRGLGPDYVGLNARIVALGSGLISIEDYGLTLNESGKELCKKGELTL